MATYGNGTFGQPSNSLWVGNNYSNMYPQMAIKSNYPTTNLNNNPNMVSFPNNYPQTQSINNILQVMGPESAQAYQVGPDSQVILMDSDKPVFYWKRSDSSGYSETKAFKFEEIPLFEHNNDTLINQTQLSNTSFVTKAEFEDYKKMIEELVMKDE